MERTIYENVSLQYLINTLNSGVHGIEDLDQIVIFSKHKPGVVIKILMVDITNEVISMMQSCLTLMDMEKYQDHFNVETDFLDFVVFTMIEEELENPVNMLEEMREGNSQQSYGLKSALRIPETEKKDFTLVNMSLTEYIAISRSAGNDPNILDNDIWNLLEFFEEDLEEQQELIVDEEIPGISLKEI